MDNLSLVQAKVLPFQLGARADLTLKQGAFNMHAVRSRRKWLGDLRWGLVSRNVKKG